MKRKGMKIILIPALVLSLALALAACGGEQSSSGVPASSALKDGVYTGRSTDHEADEDGNGSGYGEVSIEIKDNAIVSCDFSMYELDGTLKDETYGSGLSKENRLKAQKAVQSAGKYASMLVEAGSLEGIDAISGATISFDEFTEAVNDALSKASGE